jgi:hypothetical protein
MEATTRENLIISLIADDIIHTKLLETLIVMGLKPNKFNQNLGEAIMQLMGFEKGKAPDCLFNYYISLRRQAMLTSGYDQREIQHLARKVYDRLMPVTP